jgi:hypothetical protein
MTIRRQILDESLAKTTQGATLTRIYPHGNRKVRVVVKRDFYKDQSSATAEVLSDLLTWTRLADDPASNWFEENIPLARVADGLFDRAAVILSPPATNTPPSTRNHKQVGPNGEPCWCGMRHEY